MLFLIPPSETKCSGGSGLSIAEVALSFGALNPARDQVFAALEQLCAGDAAIAAKALGLGSKQLSDIETNLQVQTGPVLPAIQRYTGTLYDAIHGRGLKGSGTEHLQLDRAALARAKECVLIQSSLFGLIPATDLIPNYKLSAATSLPGLSAAGSSLRAVWAGAHQPVWQRLAGNLVIDMRSAAYAALAPVPNSMDSLVVDVVLERADGTRERMNHFNKKAKGQLLHAILTAPTPPRVVADLVALASKIGMRLERSDERLTLVTTA